MGLELAYSIHLGSDKNKKPSSKNIAKYNTILLTTSMIAELDKEEQNKAVMFLINSIEYNWQVGTDVL